MNKDKRKEKIQLIADTLGMLLQQIDTFTMNFTKEDLDIMEESKEALESKILHNMSALPLIIALGGDYDETEDKMKIATLDELISIIKARNEYKEKAIQTKKNNNRKKEILRIMGL